MTATKYTYTISTDFPNAAVSSDRLVQEIGASAIVTALDHIDTGNDACDVWFKDQLSAGDETVLDGVVAAHSGVPLPVQVDHVQLYAGNNPVPISEGKPILAVDRPGYSKLTLVTPNYCDKTTWYPAATRVVDATAADLGAHTVYQIKDTNGTTSRTHIIDTRHGKIPQEDFLVSPAGFTYRATVKVNGTIKVEQDVEIDQDDPTADDYDYTIDYVAGTITFVNALQAQDVVTCTYHYATTADYILKPLSGYNLFINEVEVQFSDDLHINDTVSFQAQGPAGVFAPAYVAAGYLQAGDIIPLGPPLRYKTRQDYIADASKSYPNITKSTATNNWRELEYDIRVYHWDYVDKTILQSALGMQILISMRNNRPFSGSYCTATLYCSVEKVAS